MNAPPISAAAEVRPVPAGPPAAAPSRAAARAAFSAALAEARITVSQHAERRLLRRGLNVGADAAARLASAIDRAAAKGSRTSLVLLNELALLVRVPERTVLTAMSPDAMRDGVVTQIDSAVIT